MKDNERAASSKFGITQTELVSLINKYKARTYTEDIDWLEKVGGTKLSISLTHSRFTRY